MLVFGGVDEIQFGSLKVPVPVRPYLSNGDLSAIHPGKLGERHSAHFEPLGLELIADASRGAKVPLRLFWQIYT